VGVPGVTRRGGVNRAERGGGWGPDRWGTAGAARQWPASARPRRARAARRGHAAWPAEQGRGEGTDRWAAATVPGGADSNRIQKYFKRIQNSLNFD
jgi:hypothetical protein